MKTGLLVLLSLQLSLWVAGNPTSASSSQEEVDLLKEEMAELKKEMAGMRTEIQNEIEQEMNKKLEKIEQNFNNTILKISREETIRTLFSYFDVNKEYKINLTPLMIAAKDGKEDDVKTLLQVLDINEDQERSTTGRTALFFATDKGYERIVKMLLEKHADVNKQDKHGYFPLYSAAREGHEEVVKLLLAAPGIDVNQQTTVAGMAALHFAARYGTPAVVKLLLDDPRVEKDLRSYGYKKETALDIAVRRRRNDIVEVFQNHSG